MKKTLAILLALMMLPALPVSAAPGDVVGNIYATDIVTYMNGAPITSYNIGGKTYIDAEILNWHYNFYVYWNETERRLELRDNGGIFTSLQAMSGELAERASAAPNTIVGQYFETDIVTTLNGKAIESYNLGGRTIICAEALTDFGYAVTWDRDARTLSISKPMDAYEYQTNYGLIRSMDHCGIARPWRMFFGNDVKLARDDVKYALDLPSDLYYVTPGGLTYIKMSDLASILGGTCEMEEYIQSHVTESGSYEAYAYMFHLTYDASAGTALREYNPAIDTVIQENLVGDFEDIYLSQAELTVNGEAFPVKGMYGGKEFDADLIVIDGEVYVPVYTAAKLLGYQLG